MTIPEQDGAELHPKYLEKLVEARLYAINEKKHSDGVIITYYCPKCSHNNTVMRPLIFHSLTMDTFMHTVSGYRFETHKCVCGTRLNYNHIVIALYSHFFPDVGLDFQAEITSGSEFVQFYRMDLEGNREPLENCMDFRYMYDAFGHVFSPRECWKRMLSTVLETGSIQLFNIENGYTIVAIPGDRPHAKVTMREILGPNWPGSSAVVVRLKELDEEPVHRSDTYLEWMPEFVDDIEHDHVDAAAVLDIVVLRNLISATLKGEGIDFTLKDDVCRIEKKPFADSFSLKEVIKDAAYRGRTFQDVIEEKLDMAVNKVFSAETLYKNIRRDMPTYDFAINGNDLEVINPRNGLSEKVDLSAPLSQGGVRALVSELREALNKNEQFRPLCKCGKDAFVFKSIEPASWLKTTKGAFDCIYEERENAVIVYYMTCGEHTNPVRKTDLAEWLVERKALDDLFEEELDSLRLNVEAHKGDFGDDVIVGAMSNNACDIMSHPAFIKGLLNAVHADLGNRVIAYAPVKEMVIVYREDADVNNLNAAFAQLRQISSAKELKQTALDYAEVFDLGEAHGIFNIITLPEKPTAAEEHHEELPAKHAPAKQAASPKEDLWQDEQDYSIEELPPEEIDDSGDVIKNE